MVCTCFHENYIHLVRKIWMQPWRRGPVHSYESSSITYEAKNDWLAGSKVIQIFCMVGSIEQAHYWLSLVTFFRCSAPLTCIDIKYFNHLSSRLYKCNQIKWGTFWNWQESFCGKHGVANQDKRESHACFKAARAASQSVKTGIKHIQPSTS